MRAPAWQRVLVTAACGYECVALWADQDRMPTVTNIVSPRPWLRAAMVVGAVVHFWPESAPV
jgi:hypothetical protein